MPGRSSLAAVLALACIACNLPRDADDTLRRVTGGTLRVGVVHNPPWVRDSGTEVDGVEPDLVGAIAASVGARIEWVRAPVDELIARLHDRELQLVIGGFVDTLPWQQQVAFTRPYAITFPPATAPASMRGKQQRHVLAAPPGENAWLMRVERVLYGRAEQR